MSLRPDYSSRSYSSSRFGEHRNDESNDSGSRSRRPGTQSNYSDHGSPSLADSDTSSTFANSNYSFRRRGTEDSPFMAGRRDQDDYSSTRSRDRSVRGPDLAKIHGGGPGGRNIEDVLSHINDTWAVMTQDDCIPVQIAVELLDYSSLGRGNDYMDFQRTSKYLQNALKAIVNEHHQGFNSSIGTFHKIQSGIATSQAKVRGLQESIKDAKLALTVAKPELKVWGNQSLQLDQTLQILGQIEQLQSVSERLDAKISDKHFLPAVDLLQDALRMIRKDELKNIGALSDLRIYLANQETSISDILIEELHDHLYLKSPYCQDRWKPYSADARDASSAIGESANLHTLWNRPLYRFLESLDMSKPMEDDASKNPEVDSFDYIHMVLEALQKLGQLDIAADRVEQRLPVELFAIVDRTNQEVDLRHGATTMRSAGLNSAQQALESTSNTSRNDILQDLLWTLYSKFEAIAEGHRAVHEVVVGIVKRDGNSSSDLLLRGFKEMWKLYQSEMRSFLHDYLATDGTQSWRSGRQPAGEGNIFQRSARDKSKRVFKLQDVDSKSKEVVENQRDMDAILEKFVPGLVSKSTFKTGFGQSVSSARKAGPAVGHKLLVEPSIFNIGALLSPTLSFLQRLKGVVPNDADIAMSTLTNFLDEFLINVFHPQFEDTVTELCTQCFLDVEAFQQDTHWIKHAPYPIFKGTYSFMMLIKSFCRLLDTIPLDANSTQILIAHIVSYHDRCLQWYRSIVQKPSRPSQGEDILKPAAALATSGPLRVLCEKLLTEQNTGRDDRITLVEETRQIMEHTNATPIEPIDIISDRRAVTTLCLTYNSMTWLADELDKLRATLPDVIDSDEEVADGEGPKRGHRSRQLSFFTRKTLAKAATSIHAKTYLPMTADCTTAFDQALGLLRNLAHTVLFSLHLDIRFGITHMLSRTMQAHYILFQAAQDPEPSILSLNTDLLATVDTLSTHLPVRAQIFLVQGIPTLIESYLIANTHRIEDGMNDHGCGRMQLNVLVLSQNLKSIHMITHPAASSTPSLDSVAVDLARAGQYYDLFLEGPKAIIARARDNAGAGLDPFSLEELKALLALWYRADTRSSVREVQVRAQRELGDHVLVLSESLWNR